MPQSPSRGEFIALLALLFATIALSIDAMLPALPEIALALSPDDPNKAQLVITSFVLGMGLGTLFAGPLSDAFGRKATILAGFALYIAAAAACWAAPSLETLLIARVLMGIAAAAPRTVSIAMVRDRFKGREMAQIMSFAMMIFTLVPAIAPLMGQGVIALAGWQAIFVAYIVFALLVAGWLQLRQPETLAPADRRPLALGPLVRACVEVLSLRLVQISIATQALTLGMLFATLSSMEGIFDRLFHRAESFPSWFAVIAVASMTGSILNARLVMRVGMRGMVKATYAVLLAVTLLYLALTASQALPGTAAFGLHILWSIVLFAVMGLTLGNLNALAMEPLGHVAGMAASVTSSIATVASVILAVPVGLMFNGTQLPLLIGVAVYAAGALGLSLMLKARA
ncbi:MFS transporter [Tabrizicola oligotrophica]|uniref:Multidrug effflux MFS transporter n=1 Tax=Tabrizicola oligotrophica TaxID=2710650 RepID=A0A6M0QNF6_9RHOB|nr:MFS transporter [Tabrizicola oligotrophica]NEY89008.1 multidrug effflux MFS transporter [Tabrizicola oligotrophica]